MRKKIFSPYWMRLGLGVLFLSTPAVQADISGKVFRDFNANGVFDTGADFNEVGMAGVTIKAFDADDPTTTPTATAASGTDGTYTLTGLSSGTDYRLEFSWTGSWLKPGVAGGTSVQFVKDGATNINAVLAAPLEYCQAEPPLATPRYISGDPTAGGTAASMAAWLLLDYTSSGDYSGTSPTLSDVASVGSLWGEAYQRTTKTLFGSAVVRRHSGLGKINGNTTTGGIYTVSLAGAKPYGATPWLDVNNLPGVDTGADPRVEEGSALPAAKDQPSHDVLAFSAVGKRGLGDIDISDDDKTLYAINLNQRTLLSIDIASKTLKSAPLPIPNPGCSNDDYRPWGLGIHEGSVYVGIVCSAETSRNTADLHAYVQRLDGSSFTNIYDFALNYNRANLGGGIDGDWQPWARVWTDTQYPSGGGWPMGKATPVLADINFDDDGSMILGFLDRTGLQSGIDNYSTDTASTNIYENEAGGDLLRICKDTTGSWIMEGNPGCTTAGGLNNNQGPNGSEYYYGENYGKTLHSEIIMGGVALLPGSNQVVATSYDPLSNVRTGGVIWLDNTSGQKIRGYELYSDSRSVNGSGKGTMGKAVGLGDLEVLCDPAPVEIGNRVWLDTDSDGIQDAGEAGIDGVAVKLTCGTDEATATTANGGVFTFSNASGGNAPFMNYGESCTLSVDGTQAPLKDYSLTAPNADGVTDNNAQTDLRDSDATDKAGTAEIAFTVGSAGENNHTLDIGYKSAPVATDLKLEKSVSPTTAKHGDTVVYTLTATNTSATKATGVTVTDKLPAGLTFVSHNGADGAYDATTGVWNVGTLEPGAAVSLQITAKVD